MPKDQMISFIIPVFNTDADLLLRAIDSVWNQTYRDRELILVDDCSTREETIKCLENLKGRSENWIRILRNEKNSGISVSRNEGIRAARGEWVAFLDHDDFIRKDFGEKMIRGALGQNADVAICGYETADQNGSVTSRFPERENYFQSDWFPWASTLIWTRLYRRSALINEDILFPEGCLAEDSVFVIKCNDRISRTAVVPFYGYIHYENHASTSFSRRFNSPEQRQIPLPYLEEISGTFRCEERAVPAAICVLTVLACMQTSGSPKVVRKETAHRSAVLIRSYPGAFSKMRRYQKNVPGRRSFYVMTRGMILSSKMHLEQFYCALMSRIMRSYYKGLNRV